MKFFLLMLSSFVLFSDEVNLDQSISDKDDGYEEVVDEYHGEVKEHPPRYPTKKPGSSLSEADKQKALESIKEREKRDPRDYRQGTRILGKEDSPQPSMQLPDTRQPVSDTTLPPYSAIAHLEVEWPDGTYMDCSGLILDDNTVATAGHCVYDQELDDWATKVLVYPGYNGMGRPHLSLCMKTQICTL